MASKRCQKKHWGLHKLVCRKTRIKMEDDFHDFQESDTA